MSELVTLSGIQPSDYKELFPIFVFDVSNQSDKLLAATVELQVYAFFKEAVQADTQAYAVVISDKMLRFQPDGNKVDVTY